MPIRDRACRAGIRLAVFLLAGIVVHGCGRRTDAPGAKPLVVYSSRAEQLIKPIFERYTAHSGVPIVYATDAEQPLIQRLLAEGEATRADILLTVDAGNLWFAANAGVLQPVRSPVLDQAIPVFLRDPENRWFGLSVRARSIVYNPQVVNAAKLTDYAGLAESQWRGRLCLRTSKKVYNQSLVAMLIAQYGEERTEEIVTGWVRNLATDVFSNDTKLLQAILAGQCELGIVNTYYLGRLQAVDPSAQALRFFWPGPATGGVHVNVSGAGVTRHSKQPDKAQALLEWLASGEAQALFASVNMEYPANPAVEADARVLSWGAFEASTMPVADAGRLQADAVRLMERAAYR